MKRLFKYVAFAFAIAFMFVGYMNSNDVNAETSKSAVNKKIKDVFPDKGMQYAVAAWLNTDTNIDYVLTEKDLKIKNLGLSSYEAIDFSQEPERKSKKMDKDIKNTIKNNNRNFADKFGKPLPANIKNISGIEVFENLEIVTFYNLDELKSIDKISSLKSLNAVSLLYIENKVSVSVLKDLPKLKIVNLTMAKTDNEDIKTISGISKLKAAKVIGEEFTDVSPLATLDADLEVAMLKDIEETSIKTKEDSVDTKIIRTGFDGKIINEYDASTFFEGYRNTCTNEGICTTYIKDDANILILDQETSKLVGNKSHYLYTGAYASFTTNPIKKVKLSTNKVNVNQGDFFKVKSTFQGEIQDKKLPYLESGVDVTTDSSLVHLYDTDVDEKNNTIEFEFIALKSGKTPLSISYDLVGNGKEATADVSINERKNPHYRTRNFKSKGRKGIAYFKSIGSKWYHYKSVLTTMKNKKPLYAEIYNYTYTSKKCKTSLSLNSCAKVKKYVKTNVQINKKVQQKSYKYGSGFILSQYDVINYDKKGFKTKAQSSKYNTKTKKRTEKRILTHKKGVKSRMLVYKYNKKGQLKSTKKHGQATLRDYRYNKNGKRIKVIKYKYSAKGTKVKLK